MVRTDVPVFRGSNPKVTAVFGYSVVKEQNRKPLNDCPEVVTGACDCFACAALYTRLNDGGVLPGGRPRTALLQARLLFATHKSKIYMVSKKVKKSHRGVAPKSARGTPDRSDCSVIAHLEDNSNAHLSVTDNVLKNISST